MNDLEKIQQTLRDAKVHEALGRLVTASAERFFEGMPGLKAGYAIYLQRRNVRAKVGAPMPPGGCFILGDSAVIAGCMAEAHMMLARLLRLPTENIKLHLERPGTLTGIRITADVAIPEGYLTPVHTQEDPKVQRAQIQGMTTQYLERCLEEINPIFRRDLAVRLAAVRQVREDLLQEVIPWENDDDKEAPQSDSSTK